MTFQVDIVYIYYVSACVCTNIYNKLYLAD